MTITVEPTSYGPAAHAALADAIAAHKSTDPLAPVAVVVGSNPVGIAARRALGRRGGVAAVTFLTPYRLAELLGASAVAATGRRPVSTPVLAGAVRAVLRDAPGRFAGVEHHPATERSLVRAHRDLAELGRAGLDRLAAAHPDVADVVRIHRSVQARLSSGFSDEHDLVGAAIAALADHPALLDQLGPTIVFLPQRLRPGHVRLLAALGERHPVHVLAGLTGDPDADHEIRRGVEALGAAWPSTPLPPAPIADRAVSVSDADEEVRHAVRAVIDAARDGVPLSRIAVLYGSPDPYARLLGDALDGAGVDWFGRSVRTADTALAGRSLLALLALPDHDLARTDVTAWMAGAPVRDDDNRPAPVAAWERAARAAGVVAGVEQWTDRLGRLADDLDREATLAEQDEEREWRAELLRRDAGQTRALSAFVAGLSQALDPGGRAGSWAGLAGWCRSLVRTYLGGEAMRADWPAEERAAGQRIDAAIERLAELDGVDPAPSVGAFRRALELQLGDDLARHGTFGSGVLVGPVGVGVGLELDRVIVLGLAEGSFPARRRDDPLLPDRVRVGAGPALPLRSDRVHDEHRALLAVMAAAAHTTFTFPRGDLRRSTERAPSRWLLDTCEARDGVRPSADDLAAATGDWFTEVPSFVAGLRRVGFPATEQEFDARTLLDAAESGADPVAVASATGRPELVRGGRLLQARLSSAYTRFDGNLATDGDLRGVTLPDPTAPGQVTSASRLEAWAHCPHAYFVRYVLGVVPVDDPDEEYRMSPLTRGSLIHDALDRWLREAIDAGAVPAPGQPWPTESVERLLGLAAAEADRLERRGQVGRRVYWGRDRRLLLDDLRTFAEELDPQQRAAYGATPVATELAFGMPGSPPPVTATLPDGRPLTVRGAIDRIDRTSSDELMVIDYKTGKSDSYRALSGADPTPGGTHLQLVLYTLAARQLLDTHLTGGRGTYWFVTARGGFTTHGYDVTPDTEALALDTVAAIVDGIAAGHHPARPAPPGWRMHVDCEACEPDGLGTGHQYADWRRKRTDPALTDIVELMREPV